MVKSTAYLLLPNDETLFQGAYTTLTAITVTGDKFATIFQAPASGSLTDMAFECGAVTTGTIVDLRLETVTSGDPSGTLQATTTNAAVTLTAGTDTNQIKSATLTSAATVTKGDLLAMVIVNGASAGNFQVRKSNPGNAQGVPYSDRSITGTWTKSVNPINGGIKIGGTWFPFSALSGAFSGSASTVQNINTGTTPDEQGNEFVADFPYQITGFFGNFTAAGATNTFDIVLYEGTTAKLTKTVDPVARQASGTFQYHFFASTYTLIVGSTYRIIMKPTSANNAGLDYMLLGTGMGAATGALNEYTYVSRTDAGAFSTTADKIAQLGLIADGIDVPQINRSYFG